VGLPIIKTKQNLGFKTANTILKKMKKKESFYFVTKQSRYCNGLRMVLGLLFIAKK
jgi:hypothetical protein